MIEARVEGYSFQNLTIGSPPSAVFMMNAPDSNDLFLAYVKHLIQSAIKITVIP